jgi:cytoskeletal protein CcmA (bactofilin family)
MIFRNDHPEAELNGFVDAGSHLHGELRFDASFRIEGKVEGSIVSDGVLVIGEGGEVDGDIRVGQIYISGTVRGTLHAAKKVQLCSQGRLFADLETPSLAIEDGAVFEGRCVMNRERIPSAPAQPVPLSAAKKG